MKEVIKNKIEKLSAMSAELQELKAVTPNNFKIMLIETIDCLIMVLESEQDLLDENQSKELSLNEVKQRLEVATKALSVITRSPVWTDEANSLKEYSKHTYAGTTIRVAREALDELARMQ